MYIISVNACNLNGFFSGLAYGINTVRLVSKENDAKKSISESSISLEGQYSSNVQI